MGYDVITIGKRDYADTSAVWLKQRKKKKPMFLAGNIADSSGKSIGKPYRIFKHKGAKIGIVSAISENYRNYFRKNILLPPVETILKAQEVFRKKKVDFQILVYLGRKKESLDLIAGLKGFDLMFLGNSNGKAMAAEIIDGQTPIIGPGDRGREIALVTLKKKKRREPALVSCDIVPLGDNIADSPKWVPFDKIFKDKMAADAKARRLRQQQRLKKARAKSGN